LKTENSNLYQLKFPGISNLSVCKPVTERCLLHYHILL